MVEKLPYLKELGITAVLFMPLYEFDEIGKFPQLYDNGYGKYASGPIAGRINYWGYTKDFILRRRLRLRGRDERKRTIRQR